MSVGTHWLSYTSDICIDVDLAWWRSWVLTSPQVFQIASLIVYSDETIGPGGPHCGAVLTCACLKPFLYLECPQSWWRWGFSPIDAIASCACHYREHDNLAGNGMFAWVRAKIIILYFGILAGGPCVPGICRVVRKPVGASKTNIKKPESKYMLNSSWRGASWYDNHIRIIWCVMYYCMEFWGATAAVSRPAYRTRQDAAFEFNPQQNIDVWHASHS